MVKVVLENIKKIFSQLVYQVPVFYVGNLKLIVPTQ